MKYAYLLWALVGGLAVYLLQPNPPAPDYPSVIVHREAIERLEPDTVVRWRDRIRYVIESPAQVAVAPGAAARLVTGFCAPTVLRVQGDTVRAAEAPRTLLLRSVSMDRGWFGHPDRLRATGPTSDGDLVQTTYRTRGSASVVTVGDSLLVRSDRFWWVKQGSEGGVFFGLGYLAARAF